MTMFAANVSFSMATSVFFKCQALICWNVFTVYVMLLFFAQRQISSGLNAKCSYPPQKTEKTKQKTNVVIWFGILFSLTISRIILLCNPANLNKYGKCSPSFQEGLLIL